MSSSLATQLAGIKANNNATILDKFKRKKVHSISLVYEPKEAAAQDFESIYYVSLEALRELETVDRRFASFEKSLFSETSIRFDRMVEDAEQAAALNAAIERFLMLVAGHLNLQPAFGALEWLVRRFQIHQFNTEALLLAALPWHASEEFVRILDIVPVQQLPPVFQFLASAKKSLKGPSRNSLVRVLSHDQNLGAAINSFVLKSIAQNITYDKQLAFWSSIYVCLIMVYKERNDSSIVDLLLPEIAEILPQDKHPAAKTAAYMVLAVLCSQFSLTDEVSEATVTTVLAHTLNTRRHSLACIAQLVRYASSEYAIVPFSSSQWTSLSQFSIDELIALASSHAIDRFVTKWTLSVLAYSPSRIFEISKVMDEVHIEKPYLEIVLNVVFKLVTSEDPFDPEQNEQFVHLVELLLQRVQVESSIIDALELALQTTLTDSGVYESKSDTVVNSGFQAELPQLDTDVSKMIRDESANMEQSSTESFLTEPWESDARIQLWIRAAACKDISQEELPLIARVSPQSLPSFLTAVALGPWPTVSRVAAIYQLEKLLELPSGEDMQPLLVPILTLLSDFEPRIRQKAADAMRALAKYESQLPRHAKVWLGGSVYGSATMAEEWMTRAQLLGVIEKLVEHLEECVMDRDYVFLLVRKSGKLAWSEFLVAQAISTPLPKVLITALRSLTNFKGVVPKLSQLYDTWFSDKTYSLWEKRASIARVPLVEVEKALMRTVRSNDAVGVRFLQSSLKRGGEIAAVAGEHIVNIWNEGVFKTETREKLAETLLEITVDDSPSAAFDPVDALLKLSMGVDLFATILEKSRLQEFSTGVELGGSKRQRRRSSSSMQFKGASHKMMTYAERHLRKVTQVLELLDNVASTIPVTSVETPRLFVALFDILEELMSLGADSNLPVLYTEELLAGCMINLVENVKLHSIELDTSAIRVNLLVSCIRTSTSPQVQNRLLLLVSTLATLYPDVVLHSVMSIFTFMGANTVRLDNDFSAYVIQQTINQVIPALVACGDKNEEIEMALMSFVAAFPHIPRHRRNKLFGALIKVLGADESLYKLLLLLGERHSESMLQKRSGDAKAIVHFTTPFLRSFSGRDQLVALEKYVRFVCETEETSENGGAHFGLLKIREAIDSIPKLRGLMLDFLVSTGGNGMVISGTRPLRTVLRLEDFTPELLTLCSALISALLPANDEHELALLTVCLELLPIAQFVDAVEPLIAKSDYQSFDVVDRKFSYEQSDDPVAVAAAARILRLLSTLEFTAPSIELIDQLVIKFGSHIDGSDQLKLLEAITAPLAREDVSLVIPAICATNSLCQHLGARMIGLFPKILPVIFSKVQRAQTQYSEEDESEMVASDEELELAAFALVAGLVQRIPSFMAPVLQQIMDLVFASHTSVAPRRQMLELVNSKMDTQTVLSSYVHSWEATLRGGMPSIELFFSTLDNVVSAARKQDVAAKAASLTTLIVKWLSSRASARFTSNEINQIEGRAINASLNIMLKLNDRVVRPMFVQIVRWGLDGEGSGTLIEPSLRQVPTLKLVCRIFSTLKSIVTNYVGYILDNVCNILTSPESTPADSFAHKLAYQSLTFSFQSDQDDFWQQSDRFDQVLRVLLAQLTSLDDSYGPLLVKALTALAESSTSQQHRKKINDGLSALLNTSATSSQKIWAVRILSSLYTKLGEDWISNLPQLVPLIAELLDDEDEAVEDATRESLVPVIEDVLGESLDRYLA